MTVRDLFIEARAELVPHGQEPEVWVDNHEEELISKWILEYPDYEEFETEIPEDIETQKTMKESALAITRNIL